VRPGYRHHARSPTAIDPAVDEGWFPGSGVVGGTDRFGTFPVPVRDPVASAELSTPLPLRGQRRAFTGFPILQSVLQQAGTFDGSILVAPCHADKLWVVRVEGRKNLKNSLFYPSEAWVARRLTRDFPECAWTVVTCMPGLPRSHRWRFADAH